LPSLCTDNLTLRIVSTVSISCAALLLPTWRQNRELSGMGQFWTPIAAKGGALLHAVLHPAYLVNFEPY
jgi:hypothetical protein